MTKAPRTVYDLHSEHIEWLSDLEHWDYELRFLSKLLQNSAKHAETDAIKKAVGELENRIHHHQTLLKNLRQEIHSHEAFIKDQFEEESTGQSESGIDDHHKNRRHIMDFKSTLKTLKGEIYQLYEQLL